MYECERERNENAVCYESEDTAFLHFLYICLGLGTLEFGAKLLFPMFIKNMAVAVIGFEVLLREQKATELKLTQGPL